MSYPISSYDSSIQEKLKKFLNKRSIEEQCSEESLIELKNAFMDPEMKMMDKVQLQNAFENILHIFLDDEEFDTVFKKINAKNDDLVTWDEFISYLLLEMKCKDIARYWKPMDPPITDIPNMKQSHHRNPVCKIVFCPEILLNRNWNYLRGCYLTASKDGNINYWSIDLKYQRSVKSFNPLMKFQTTMITDMIVMPDIKIVCTSSVERDLRFYDTVGNRFDLRVMITHFPSAIVSMSYYFSKNIQEESFIILGDMNGEVKTFSFSPIDKGPFKHFTKQDVLQVQYNSILAGELENLKVKEFSNFHSNWVSQVAYYGSLKSFISCSKCSENSLIIMNPNSSSSYSKFHVPKGINCFTFCEESQILVTGGVDFIVRVWNPFIPKKEKFIIYGHQTPISAIFIQNQGNRIFSLSQDRCIQVFDVFSQSCMQTYTNLPRELGNNSPMTAVFNHSTQKMIIANQMIAILSCGKIIDKDISDGHSHLKSVSCVLYNHLFQVIVSTSLDSCITVWNPWLGQRLSFISKAHCKLENGEKISFEITAACFDDTEHLLVTGARDGSIKLWQFNTGSCIREMMSEPNSEITGLAWYDKKIFSVGWDRVITEFTETELGIFKKSWEIRHTEDITCLSIRPSQALVTASFNGEIILWRLETGQPYRIYIANNPTERKVIDFRKDSTIKLNLTKNKSKTMKSMKNLEKCKIKPEEIAMRPTAVTVALFLNSRPMAANIASLMIALESGLIQVWTHHPGAGFLAAFSAIHQYGDFVTSMTTDPENEFLITGHKRGYIKVWLLKNYMIPNPPKINMCELRLEFPFLWKDKINGRAKRAVRYQPLPLLLSSVGGHKQTINSVQFIPEARIIISGCSDHTIKLWTLSGRYISTLGTFKPWIPILPNIPIQNYFIDYQLPPDVKKSASFTTMKVLQGGAKLKEDKEKLEKIELTEKLTEDEISTFLGRQSQTSSLDADKLSNYQSSHMNEDLLFDCSTGYIPVYNYLKTNELDHVQVPAALLLDKMKDKWSKSCEINHNKSLD